MEYQTAKSTPAVSKDPKQTEDPLKKITAGVLIFLCFERNLFQCSAQYDGELHTCKVAFIFILTCFLHWFAWGGVNTYLLTIMCTSRARQ